MEAKTAERCVVRMPAWTERRRNWRLVTHLSFLLAVAILSCTDVSVTAVDVAEITLEPASLTLAVGETGKFTATLRDPGGNVLTGRAITWSSTNSSAVTVGSNGSVIALAAGSATIRASSEGEQAEASVSVSPPPVIAVQPALATFRVPAGGPAPAPIQVAIRNDGPGALDDLTTRIAYNAGEPGGWLTASLESSTAPTTLSLTAAPGGLGEGTYTAAVTVSSPSSIPSSQTVSVVLEIVEAVPSIVLDATSVLFSAFENGTDPASQTVAVSNGGGGTLTGLGVSIGYDSGQPAGWLSANLNSTTAPATLTLSAATGSLAIGTYSATVSTTSGIADNSPRTIDVTFTVTAVPPTLVLAPATVIMTATAGGVNPAPQNVTVTNGGTGTITGLAQTVNYPAAGASGWLVATLNGTSTPASLGLAVDIGALAVGVHTATVAVTSSNATNSPQNVDVTLTVNPSVAVPGIALSPTSIAFSATAGGSDPASQIVDVTNNGTGTLSGIATSITYGSGQPSGWLNASLSGTTAPATITLQATTGSLAAGTYDATLEVTSATAGNSPQNVDITFTVAAAPVPPAIGLSQSSASFSATSGGSNPSSQTVNVTNTGGGTLSGVTTSVTYASGQPTGWLNASLSGTTAPATITLQAATGSLAAGTYNATVNVTSSVASNSPQTVNVTFTVAAAPVAPAIGLSRADVLFNATAGGANPATESLNVTNTGGGTLNGLGTSITYASGQPSGWLNASLSSTTAPATITLQATTGSLATGTYTATLRVSSGIASNSPQTVNIRFTVSAAPVPPAISLSQSNISFSATAGGSSPSNQTLNVTNTGGGTLNGLGTSVTYASGQPSGWLNASLSGTTAPASITLQATTGSLAAGTYDATVHVTSSVASNSPQTIDVTFTVAPPPAAIGLAPTSVTFNATAGSGDPAAASVAVTNTGGQPLTGLSVTLSYTSGQPGGWLTANLDQTTAPATITLQPVTGSLAAGTYDATVSVASSVASNSPQTVSVTFTVAPAPLPPTIGLSATNVAFTATAGSGDPANQSVNVTNTGGGTVDGLSTTITYASGQPSGWLDASLSGTTAPATLTLQATTGSLAPGNYSATVSVASNTASNSPQAVNVSFTVTTPPAIGVSPSSVSFNAMAGGGDPASQNVSVTNTGGGTLSGLATSVTYVTGPSGWLTASLNGATAPVTLNLQATTGALAPGTYTANVAVTSNVAANSPQTVTVTFTVAPVPPPAAPTNLNANGQGNMIRLSWDDNSNNEQSFEVQRNTTGANGPWTTLASLPANTVDYRDRNYAGGVTYWYRVLACNAGGCTSSNVDTGSN
jgi:uncharacterized membrane protein